MPRTSLKAAAVVTLAALFTGSATASFGATAAEEVKAPTPIDSPTGNYIVLLEEAPVADYDGGVPGYAPTKPDEGEKLDTHSTEVEKYSAFLEKRQEEVAAEAGVTPGATYQFTLNGFSAQMSPQEAGKLATKKGVYGVYPDEIKHPDAVPSTEFLGLEGAGGVWEGLGGVDAAGDGIVVGVVDTGIAPENPSFAGDPLGTTPGDEPYLDGNEVVYLKADGNEFRSDRVTGEGWTGIDEYSTKLIGAKYFLSGATAAGFNFDYDFESPRDGDGHGSHTASTAAGNNGVAASVEGVDFGTISGVAPAAKVAMYKACYVGPDPLVTSDDICAGSDLLAAIDAAVGDGVDVINYSIGGGAATTTWSPDDIQFFLAAQAGVFVSVSAGNAGPDSTTADHASPWYTTVAASTIPTWEGTVEFTQTDGSTWQAVGATVTVPADEPLTGPVVYAGDIAAAGADPTEAALCFLDTLDPALAAGNIVVCDRGINARVEKSQAVAEAGGIGSVLVNVTPGSLDNDFHSVPTVHIQSDYRDALLAHVQGTTDPTITLIGENVTGIETPVPQVAGFSSRGPMNADGSDILKPDVAAPGVAILAATDNGPGEEPTFGVLSGTSMAAPHVAGLGALYLSANPLATPAEVKSALMTTAYDTVDATGAASPDPFAQGAGQVDATRYLDPGLLYLSGPYDWAQFVQGTGNYDFGVEPIDGSDLNLASIAVGTLSSEQTVTRTVTATRAGTYTVSASIPGVDVTVSPSTLTFGAAGEEQSFTVTFTPAGAPVEEWATGFLTWTGADGTTVRSPLAVQPVTADAPSSVSGTGTSGSVDVEITPGVTGELALNLGGLTPAVLQTEAVLPNGDPVPGHSGNQDTGDEEGYSYYLVDVPEGSKYALFDLASSNDETTDLDLFVYRIVSPTDWRYYSLWQSATAAADERVELQNPTPGTYLVEVHVYSFTEPFTWDLTTAVVGEGGEGSLTATPNPLPVTQGTPTTYSLSWSGLAPETHYVGVVTYGDSAVQTVLHVESGQAAPTNTKAPSIKGTPKVGQTLKADPGTWNPKGVAIAYQWLRDGAPIPGATSQSYKVAKADIGTALSVQVTATQSGNSNAGVAVSESVFVKFSSKTQVSVNRYLGTSSQDYAVTVKVSPSGGAAATGEVTVWVNTKKYTGVLTDGSVTIPLPKQKRGIYVVTAVYPGSDTIEGSAGLTGFIVLL